MSVFSISNSFLDVKINSVGAEICSIRSNISSIEYFWSGEPSIWSSTSPVLFPIIGALKEGFFYFEGKKYSVPKHGFIRNNSELKVIHHSEDLLMFRLVYDEKSLKIFPFKFEFQISFQLDGYKLKVEHLIKNLDENNPLYFSLGGHPAFRCPFNVEDNYEDYFLEFEEKETLSRWQVTKEGLLGQKSTPFMEDSNVIELTHELFNDDAIVFKNLKSRKISLKSNKSSNYLTIEFPDFNYLGVWAKPNGDFVCIEPWLGVTDSEETNYDFKTKEGIIELKENSIFQADYSIEIIE